MIELAFQKSLRSAKGQMELTIDLQIERGSLLALYGPSGAGKTSILRIIAGLLDADRGQIIVEGVPWLDVAQGIHWSPQQRKVGFVFQDYALFPHLTVEDNLRFALLKNQSAQIIPELIEMMELGGLSKHRPTRLSGGQKQRVALARALVQRPALLLLDEPLSALDQSMRHKLQDYLLRVHQRYGLTTILVSHEVVEIQKMATQLVQLEEGQIIAQGKPHDILGDHQIQLRGVIQSIADRKARVDLGQQQITVVLSEEQRATLEVGDTIHFCATLLHPHLKKAP